MAAVSRITEIRQQGLLPPQDLKTTQPTATSVTEQIEIQDTEYEHVKKGIGLIQKNTDTVHLTQPLDPFFFSLHFWVRHRSSP